jgi:hypothetical protein
MTQKNSKAKSTSTSDLPCTCKRGDDGSPMVHCAECSRWCVDLGAALCDAVTADP